MIKVNFLSQPLLSRDSCSSQDPAPPRVEHSVKGKFFVPQVHKFQLPEQWSHHLEYLQSWQTFPSRPPADSGARNGQNSSLELTPDSGRRGSPKLLNGLTAINLGPPPANVALALFLFATLPSHASPGFFFRHLVHL